MSSMTMKCAHCGKPNAPSKCSKCKTTHYCNRECQALDWKRHKKEDCVVAKKSTKPWRYSAPFQTFSYWASLGHGHAYAAAMMEFQGQFTEAVSMMRRSMYGTDVIFNYPLEAQDGNTTVILHDEALLPHWREVAKALKINSVFLRKEQEDETKSNRSLDFPISAEELEKMPRKNREFFEDSNVGNVQFIMDKVELRKEVIDVIAPPLAQSPFDRILLEYNSFDREGIVFAIDLLKQNRYASQYSLIGSPIESDADLNLLSTIISTHPSLRELSLAHCASPTINNPDRFNPIISASMGLKTLDLSGNNIESVIIADSLASNPPLKELCLQANNFNDDDAELIANALNSNTNLWQLDLKENSGIGRRGCTALLKAIFNHESLNSVSSSNHTCDILVSRYKIPTFNGDVSGGEVGIIRAKKFALLAPPGKQDLNVGLLHGAPLELMHKVLEFVQAYPEKGEWTYVEDLLQCKDLLESANHDEDSTDFTHEFMTGMGIHDDDEEEEEDLQGIPMAEFQRQQAEAVKLAQIKSLSVLMSVVKGVVVPMFFSA